MRINKFREIEDCDQREHKKKIESGLDSIKLLISDGIGAMNENSQLINYTIDAGTALISNTIVGESQSIAGLLDTKIESVNDTIEFGIDALNHTLSGLKPRTNTTKIVNQKIEEDIIILETSDDLFNLPEVCQKIFEPTSQLKEINQFFILEEGVEDSRCQERVFNFDVDQKHAIRLDSFLGDEDGYIKASGFMPNNSSDVTIINNTLYKIKIRIDEADDYLGIDDGFSITVNDIEKESEILIKRDHTISGYSFDYVVEDKMNS